VVWRHPLLSLLVAAYVGWGAWNWLQNRAVDPPDGVLAPDDPIQDDIPMGGLANDETHFAGWTLRTRAHYHITARILGVERYHIDALARLAPEDLALGWGPMSDNETLRTFDISQSNRFFYWRPKGAMTLPRETVIAHSANTHVIPADSLVARRLSHLRRGEVVTLTGDLVDGVRGDGASIRTSLVRTDTGPGACEVMLVREVAIERVP
jgi:hypothetical protein